MWANVESYGTRYGRSDTGNLRDLMTGEPKVRRDHEQASHDQLRQHLQRALANYAQHLLLGQSGVLIGALGHPLALEIITAPRGFARNVGAMLDALSMAIAIGRAIAKHGGLGDGALDTVAAGFHDWAKAAQDVGNQTRHVLGAARFHGRDAAHLTTAARAFADANVRSDGNGSLMRTAPVALAYLDDPAALAAAATVGINGSGPGASRAQRSRAALGESGLLRRLAVGRAFGMSSGDGRFRRVSQTRALPAGVAGG